VVVLLAFHACVKGGPEHFDLIINFYALSGGTHKRFPSWSDASKDTMRVRGKEFYRSFDPELSDRRRHLRFDEPVNSAAGVAISVNRDAKGDRLPLLPQPSRRDSIKNEKPASKKSLVGCEPAFSRFAHPAYAQIFTHCAA
jgi:hypothetical protein